MSKLKNWFLAARPKTLTASLVPIIAAVGWVSGGIKQPVNWWLVTCAVLSSICIQIGTNLVNDAMDYKKGADNEKRIGPLRVTQQGYFTYKHVMLMAGVFFLAAVALGIPLVMKGGVPIVVIGLISVAMGYAYTSGPFPLAYLGLGDLFVIVFFGLIAVGGMGYILTGMYHLSLFVLGLQIGCLSAVLIAINNLRDIHTDQEVNKKTLCVRLGVKGSRYWIAVLILVPFIFGYYWLYLQRWWVYAVPVISFPLGFSIIKKIFRTEPSPIYNKFLAQAAAYSLIFSVLIYLGFQL